MICIYFLIIHREAEREQIPFHSIPSLVTFCGSRKKHNFNGSFGKITISHHVIVGNTLYITRPDDTAYILLTRWYRIGKQLGLCANYKINKIIIIIHNDTMLYRPYYRYDMICIRMNFHLLIYTNDLYSLLSLLLDEEHVKLPKKTNHFPKYS